MSASQPPNFVVRQYRFDNEYTADATIMAAAGWRVTYLRRAPDNIIIATYTYGGAPITPVTPLSEPSAPTSGTSAAPSFTEPESPAQSPQSLTQPLPLVNPARQTRINRIALGVAAALVILLCATCAVSGALSSASNASALATAGASASATTSSAYATTLGATQTAVDVAFATQEAQATIPAQPTAAPPPPGLTGATLGGPDSAFDAMYGSAPHGTWYDVNIHGQIVTLMMMGSNDTAQSGDVVSSDGLDRVFTITVEWVDSAPPSLTQKRATIATFFPPQTVYIGTYNNGTTTEYLYRSTPLAAMFSSGAFINNAYQPVTPGTFFELCDSVSCTLMTGE